MTDHNLLDLAEDVEEEARPIYQKIEKTAFRNQQRVLDAFRRARVSDFHLKGSTGYGYGDQGRETLERVYAEVFGAEKALVRGQIVSGTHALALCFFGILRPGDELLAIQGPPYDTLQAIIGTAKKAPGNLREWGVSYRQVELLPDGTPDWAGIAGAISGRTKMVFLQRSRGYTNRPSLNLQEMKKLISFLKSRKPDVVVCVDNCYGEFVEDAEPPAIGADLAAGSLIKNPGGGLAPGGGYVVGQARWVEMAASRWTAPGIGGEVGPAPEFQRLLFQGLFIAPHVVAEALKGAVFAARFCERLGFAVSPSYREERTDIIQEITLGSREQLLAFCRGIQSASPVDAHVRPEPAPLPGYSDPVIMAAGTFVQGASLELSADAPVKEPYRVYLQGGLTKEHVKLAVISAAQEMLGKSR